MIKKRGDFSYGKENDVFDVVKFALSILVVSIHSEIVPDILIPFVRTAVPLFFIISSYLLKLEKKKRFTWLKYSH